ncbi:MAG: hypothetical protein Kow0092_36480 [Deferrisomatales bacterium]
MNDRRRVLLQGLRDSDPQVRARASAALDRLDALEHLDATRKALSQASVEEWVRVLRSFAELRDPGCLRLGLRALGHPEENVRMAALELVEAYGDWRATPHLGALLDDPSPTVRARTVEVLGRIGDPRAAPQVAARLDDPDPAVVLQAAVAVGRLGHGAAEPRLLALARHDDPHVRAAALEALGRIPLLTDR